MATTGETLASGVPRNGTPMVLGTVQLGKRYGIGNTSGQPDPAAAAELVRAAWDLGVTMFDTAPNYGSSEEVLGGALRAIGAGEAARVVSKVERGEGGAGLAAVQASVRQTLARLQRESLWGLMLHDEDDLSDWAGATGASLRGVRAEGLVDLLGVSVYGPERAHEALGLPEIDLIQVPANVFDRRMARTGFFSSAQKAGKIVFVRSVFLQGLALLGQNADFRGIPRAKEANQAFRHHCERWGVSPQQFAVSYIRNVAPEARVILGAETVAQVRENCALFSSAPLPAEMFAEWDRLWPADDPRLLDPRTWPAPKS